ICCTPIGNLNDASFRLIDTLKEVELIAAEDTRTTRKLLLRYDIKRPESSITGYQDYSSKNKKDRIIGTLLNGFDVALVSESGTPSIQDPGYKLVQACIEAGIKISIIPGPNAALSALVISGLSTDSFLFIGFLPKKQSKIREKIESIKYLPFTLIFYESPLRISVLLKLFLEILGDRQCCIVREITKIYEEAVRGKISEIMEELEKRKSSGAGIKGEITVVVKGFEKTLIKDFSEAQIQKEYKNLMKSGMARKEALKFLKSKYDIEKNLLYKITLVK
ncbi:MAG: 16S rRNA (cytidine(1402)-2'-O)-methyltransferase, partial [Actinobacteria bacterium]|nr:16S rRNA (cytidine(1402)-2'-O)-methyltransferase [Actinomycetota bacterium]